MCQFADLLSDDGEALPCLTGPRRLDAGIERQQVGLEGNFIDDVDDVTDPRGRVSNVLHRLDCLAHDDRRLGCVVACSGG